MISGENAQAEESDQMSTVVFPPLSEYSRLTPSTRYGSQTNAMLQNPYESFDSSKIPPPPPRRRHHADFLRGLLIGILLTILILTSIGVFLYLKQAGNNLPQGNLPETPVVAPSRPPSPTPAATATANVCSRSFSDAFQGRLHPGWSWVNLGGNATNAITAHGLRIAAPPDADLSPSVNEYAPRLLQSITGDFTIETRISFNPTAQFQSAGLLLWQDENTFLRFERAYYDKTSNGILFQKEENGKLANVTLLKDHPAPVSVVELSIRKSGNRLTASWREPEKDWQIDGEIAFHFDTLMVGVDLINLSQAPLITASYSYFLVSCSLE